jgi:hypothetical protein
MDNAELLRCQINEPEVGPDHKVYFEYYVEGEWRREDQLTAEQRKGARMRKRCPACVNPLP